MKRLHTHTALALLLLGSLPVAVKSQITFANSNARLSVTDFHSGVGISVLDMDGDGLDDIARMDDGYKLQLQKQRTGQQFVTVAGVNINSGSAWSMVVGDANEDGYRDVAAGFGSGAYLSLATAGGAGYNAATALPSSNFFLQNMNFADVDNDGDADIFGCNDNGESKIWLNNGSGSYTISNIINFDVTPGNNVGTSNDDSGNYGSIWSDFDNDGDVDLYIAKCRQSVNVSTDPRRIDLLFVNNGNGTYTENAVAHGLGTGAQTWTASFDDIDNDGWFDILLTNHDVETMLMHNDGTGHFTDINVGNGAGLNINFTPYQSKMMDFDNDGWIDVLITGDNGSSASGRLFRNNHNNTFTAVTNAFPSSANNAIHSFGLGDLNHDGKMDIYAGYATGYTSPSNVDDVLWLNTTDNENHFVTFNLQGTTSNRDALGARIFLYGDWGVQTREVRSGESYGTCNTFNLHFGLGSATDIDSAIIKWPSGTVTKLFDKPVDQFITVIEGQCSSPNNEISYVGSPVICTGQSVTLSAPAGYTYLWSNGATTQTTQVTTAGEYSVKVTSGSCSSISPIVAVEVSPDETPSVVALGDLTFCAGGSVTLQGPANVAGYHWTGGATTQELEVTESGTYTLTIDGSCQQWASAPVTVDVLASPAPVIPGASVMNSGSVTLTATSGTDLEWYDQATNGNLINSGNSYTTPVLTNTTTYYVQGTTEYPGATNFTGQTDHAGTSDYSGGNGTNATTYFTVLEACTLKTAKVYTDLAGNRLIQVKDAGNNVVASATINIPVTTALPGGSTRIDLNFALAPGTYTIGTDGATNTTNFGFTSPRLKRTNGTGVAYPYTVTDVISITGCSEGNTLFYYFYDWEVVSGGYECVSPRTPVTVTVLSDAGIAETAGTGLLTYPNPTEGQLNIKASQTAINGATLKVLDVTGKTVYAERTVNMAQGSVKTIDVQNLASGIYTLELANGEMVYNVKFIVR